jgi:lipid A ethanolaminephosphotransferase
MRNGFKVLLVVLSLAAGYEHYSARVAQLSASSVWMAAAYLGLVSLLSLALLAAAFVRNPILRWSYAVLFAGAATFWDANLYVTGEFLTYDAFVSQIDAFSFVNEALDHYWQSIVAAATSALLLLVGIGLRPTRARWLSGVGEGGTLPVSSRRFPFRSKAPAPMAAVAPAIALLMVTVILFARGGDGGRGLPSMYMSLAYLNLFAYESLTQSVGPREGVQLPHSGRSPSQDLVLIIDESVSGNYLDINTPNGVPTPLGHPPDSVRVINFGYAASITNCSAGVNYTLRFGGTRDDYVRINARMPSIWQYAKAAGLETVFIDAQRTGGMLINRMNKGELADIDQWLQFNDVAVRDRDMATAAKLASLFADGAQQFIYVNKMGAHFPIHDKAPDEFVRYRPALPRGSYGAVADSGQRFGIGDSAADWVLYRNSYRNTLLWTVGEFFNRLFGSGQLDGAVIIYTSDHGQDLHERGNPGLNTHCGQSPVMEEGLVPLLVVEGAGVHSLDWTTHLEENRNHSSHFNIFPTLLELMGYAPDAVQAIYGRPLTVPTRDPFTFNSRFNARLGRPPKWERIDLTRIVTPPADTAAADEAEPARGPAGHGPRKKDKT